MTKCGYFAAVVADRHTRIFRESDCGRFCSRENVGRLVNDDRLPVNGTRCASYRSGGIIGGESRTGLSGARDREPVGRNFRKFQNDVVLLSAGVRAQRAKTYGRASLILYLQLLT